MTPPKVAPLAFPRSRLRLLFAAAGALVLAAGWATTSVQTVLRQRSRAAVQPKPYSNPYPQTQNGLSLVAVKPARNLDTHPAGFFSFLWGQPTDPVEGYASSFPTVVIALTPGNASPAQCKGLGRASNGDTFTLDVNSSFTAPKTKGGTGTQTYLTVCLPTPGVPENYQWIDVTVDDKQGHRGTWRIYDLPRLKHALLPTGPLHQAETVQNIKLEARAWWDAKAAPPITKTTEARDDVEALPVVGEVKAVFPHNLLSSPGQVWDIEMVSMREEWEDAARPAPYPQGGFSGFRSSQPWQRTVNGAGETLFVTAQAAAAPHPSAQHIAQITAKLTQYDTMEERVTFRNVPLEAVGNGWRTKVGGATLNTPSGIRVQILQPKDGLYPYPILTLNDVAVRVTVSPNGRFPASPLQKRVGEKRPLRITCEVQPFSQMLGVGNSSDPEIHTLNYQQPLTQPFLPDLTITIKQEAELQSTPFTFTVPVRQGKPKEEWNPSF